MGKVVLNLNFTSKNPPRYLSAEKKAEYIARRNFYNLTANYNYFSYVLQDKKVQTNATAEEYFTKNFGLFDWNGALTEKDIEGLKENLKNTDSIIWHGVISFDEETSVNFEEQGEAIKFLDKTFGGLIDQTHLKKENLTLYASLHKDTDNRHIHFAFFETEPKHVDKNGNVGFTQKGTLNTKAIENYLINSNMHLSEEKDLYYEARDEISKSLKAIRGEDLKSLTSEIKKELKNLIEKLPKNSRLSYSSENMKGLRKDIDGITELLVKSDNELLENHKRVLEELSKRERIAREICLENSFAYINGERVKVSQIKDVDKKEFTYKDTITGETKKLTVDTKEWSKIESIEKLRFDYYSRLGNQVIGLALDYRKATNKKRTPKKYNDHTYKRQQRVNRQKGNGAINQFMKMFQTTGSAVGNEYLRKIKEIEKEKEREKENN